MVTASYSKHYIKMISIYEVSIALYFLETDLWNDFYFDSKTGIMHV